jgi:hypothetical protein
LFYPFLTLSFYIFSKLPYLLTVKRERMRTPKYPIAVGLLMLSAVCHAQFIQMPSSTPIQLVPQPFYCMPTVATGTQAVYPGTATLTPTPIVTTPSTNLPAIEDSKAVRLSTTDSSVLPLTLPGYELRVMDITKKVTYDVGGTPVVAEVPIFVYVPRSPKSVDDATKELRKIYNDLILVYDQERVDKDRIRSMLKRMDSVIDTFDSMTPAVSRHTTAATE